MNRSSSPHVLLLLLAAGGRRSPFPAGRRPSFPDFRNCAAQPVLPVSSVVKGGCSDPGINPQERLRSEGSMVEGQVEQCGTAALGCEKTLSAVEKYMHRRGRRCHTINLRPLPLSCRPGLDPGST
jgi:hypothetical protein